MTEKQGAPSQPLAQIITENIDENVFLCYQCVKCTSGCPLAEYMDLNPNQVLRAVQLGDESVLESNTIWICAACQTCTTRCPQGIDIAAIMDELRIESKKRGIEPALPDSRQVRPIVSDRHPLDGTPTRGGFDGGTEFGDG